MGRKRHAGLESREIIDDSEDLTSPVEVIPESPVSEPKGFGVAKRDLAYMSFANEENEAPDPRANDVPAPERSVEMSQKNRQAALEAVKRLSVSGPNAPSVLPNPPKLSAERAEELRPKLFRVVRTEVIRRGSSSYTLPAGKVISDRSYDIQSLKHLGVELVELPPVR